MPRPTDAARQQAREAGARHYQGRPCAKGHTLRHTVNGGCVTCQNETQRARRARAIADPLEGMFA